MKMNRESKLNNFEQATMPYLNNLFRTALRLAGNSLQAEELVEKTYLQAWKSFNRMPAGINSRIWLFQTFFQVIREKDRHYSLSQPDQTFINHSTTAFAHNVCDDGSGARSVTDQLILAALMRLPRPLREVLLLADVEEFTSKEVALILNLPPDVVMSRLRLGRVRLGSEMTDSALGIGSERTKDGIWAVHA